VAAVLSEDMPYFTALRSLRLDNNRLRDAAPLAALPVLRALHLSCNRLATLPDMRVGFSALEVLHVSFNHLPPHALFGPAAPLACMPSLRDLCASGNAFKALPHALGPWPALQRLELEHNGLSAACLVPLSALPGLRHLSVAHNRIGAVPAEIAGGFRQLTCLDLTFNQLR